MPGLAKTLLVSTVARISSLSFRRIQFTPDMMPSDITGTDILQDDPETGRRRFTFIAGPIFANIILADEINRTPPKTQAALLEAMQERHVTAGGVDLSPARPVLRPGDAEPDRAGGDVPAARGPARPVHAQRAACPTRRPTRSWRSSGGRPATRRPTPAVTLSAEQIVAFQHLVRRVPVPEHVFHYARDLVRASRPQRARGDGDWCSKCVSWGAGPRAGQSLDPGRQGPRRPARPVPRRRSPTSATSPGPSCGTGSSPPSTPRPKGSAPTRSSTTCSRTIPAATANAPPAGSVLVQRERRWQPHWRSSRQLPSRSGTRTRLDAMTDPHPERLDPTALARFGRLELLARLVVEGVMSGLHKSPFKGFSVEFAEHRQYGPGDEIRHIDWRAFGKTDRYLRQGI